MEFGELVVEGVVCEIFEEVQVDVEVVSQFVYFDILFIGQVCVFSFSRVVQFVCVNLIYIILQ